MLNIWVQDSDEPEPEFIGHDEVDLEWFLDAHCDSEYLTEIMEWFQQGPKQIHVISNGDTAFDIWYTTPEK